MEDERKVEISNLIEFSKIVKDLLNDLLNTFPDKTENIILKDENMVRIMKYEFNKENTELEEEFITSATILYNFCKNVFPLKFFDILYQNEEIFSNETELFLLPNINFVELYFYTTSNQTKETLWKYLQLILFTIITNIQDKESFGNNEKLFEAINSDEFKNKLQETVKSMENLFSQNEFVDS